MIRSNPEELIRKTMATFVDKELIPRAKEIDEKGEFPMEMFQQIGRMGVFGIRYPKNKGGSGGNTTLYCIICEELARGLMSVAAVTAMQCLTREHVLDMAEGLCVEYPPGDGCSCAPRRPLEDPEPLLVVEGVRDLQVFRAIPDVK